MPTDRPVATLSGGQRAQVGLGLALAKRPRLLLLDEPVAALDPLARREFLAALSEAVADGDLSVILSSHLLHDLERVCDHVILLSASRVAALRGHRRRCSATHRMLVGPRRSLAEVEPGLTVINATQTAAPDPPARPPAPGPCSTRRGSSTRSGSRTSSSAYMGSEAGTRRRASSPRSEVAP